MRTDESLCSYTNAHHLKTVARARSFACANETRFASWHGDRFYNEREAERLAASRQLVYFFFCSCVFVMKFDLRMYGGDGGGGAHYLHR